MRSWGLVLGAFREPRLPRGASVLRQSSTRGTLGASAAPALLLWVLPVLLARRASTGPAQVRVGPVPEVARLADEELAEEEERAEMAERRHLPGR